MKSIMRDTTFQSSAYGKRENVETTIFGRVIFDLLPYMYRNHKLSSYSLNSVSAEFLGQQKEDVHHSIISDLQQGRYFRNGDDANMTVMIMIILMTIDCSNYHLLLQY